MSAKRSELVAVCLGVALALTPVAGSKAEATAELMLEVAQCFFRIRAIGQKTGLITSWGGGAFGFLRSLAVLGPLTVPQIAQMRPLSLGQPAQAFRQRARGNAARQLTESREPTQTALRNRSIAIFHAKNPAMLHTHPGLDTMGGSEQIKPCSDHCGDLSFPRSR